MARVEFIVRIGVNMPRKLVRAVKALLVGALYKIRRRIERRKPMSFPSANVVHMVKRKI